MGIDVRFIQQLPATFIDQDSQNGQPGIFRFIRTADSNHDGNLTRAEIFAALPREQNQSQYDRELMAQHAERDISRSASCIREAIQSGQINLNRHTIPFRIFEPRSTHSSDPRYQTTWNHRNIDRNQNGAIDRNEILTHLRNSLNPRLDLLGAVLNQSAEGLYQMESQPEHRGIHNLLHYATYIPLHLIHPVEGFRNLFSNGPTTEYSWRRLVIETAEARHIQRQGAIQSFMRYLREHPEQSIQDCLAHLSEQHRTLLIDDLQVQNWQSVLTAPSREEMIDGYLLMTEHLMQGAYSSYSEVGAMTLPELLTVPLKAENYAMANNVITALENEANLNPEQRARLQNLRERIRSINLGGILEIPRADSLNEIFDFTVSIAVEILLLRGGLRLLKAGKLAVGASLAKRGAIGLYLAGFLGYIAPAAEGAAATNPASPGIIRRGLGYLGTGLGWTFQTITGTAGATFATNLVNPPERHRPETDFTLHLPEPDINNAWVNANLASLALAIYQAENP